MAVGAEAIPVNAGLASGALSKSLPLSLFTAERIVSLGLMGPAPEM